MSRWVEGGPVLLGILSTGAMIAVLAYGCAPDLRLLEGARKQRCAELQYLERHNGSLSRRAELAAEIARYNPDGCKHPMPPMEVQ